jgi:hypothetical protein
MFILMLAGHVLRPGSEVTEEERLKAMAMGRQQLRQFTGQDFGYDLNRWHEHLLTAKEEGYRHPYAWRTVRPAIEKALDDDRRRLVEKLEQGRDPLTSKGLAVVIIDALVDTKILNKEDYVRAVDTAAEIEVRKALGDY